MEQKVLVIGYHRDVISSIVDELTATGFGAQGVAPDKALSAPLDRFDVIAFGEGIAPPIREEIERRYREQPSWTRFISIYSPYAVSQIIRTLSAGSHRADVDLGAYCKRIGYDGALTPTLQTLVELQSRHLASIAFEAIDVLLGRPIDISPAGVDQKLIRDLRGGYCFEQNGLFKRVLETIGFEVTGMVASVRWMAAPGVSPPPRTHMVLSVIADGREWLVDVGFGSAVPPSPLLIDTEQPQTTRHGEYRILPWGAGLLLQARITDDWKPVYDVSFEPLLDEHYELLNWFTSTHPSSHFRQHLIAARTDLDARYSLIDRRLTIRRAGGASTQEVLHPAGVTSALREHFMIEPPPQLEARIAHLK